MDFNPQAVIGRKPGVCPACGAACSADSRVCPACHHDLTDEDDEAGLDVVAEEGVPASAGPRLSKKFPVEKSKNLVLVQEAAAGIQDGSLSVEAFRAKVEEAKRVAEQGVQLMSSDVVKSRVASLPREQRDISHQTAAMMGQAVAGYKIMLEYLQSSNLEDVRSGLEVVEKAFYGLDRLREKAIDAANAES